VAKVGTSNPDRTISLKRLQCVVDNKHKRNEIAGVKLEKYLDTAISNAEPWTEFLSKMLGRDRRLENIARQMVIACTCVLR
jgi:rhamnose utilization protein RhaD (predicted bifunctional aldolase and dehydrogenase)